MQSTEQRLEFLETQLKELAGAVQRLVEVVDRMNDRMNVPERYGPPPAPMQTTDVPLTQEQLEAMRRFKEQNPSCFPQ